MPETGRRSLVRFRCAVRFLCPIERAPNVGGRGPLDIVGHEQIEITVLVVVKPGRTCAELVGTEKTGFFCDVLKSPVCIAKQEALSECGDEEIRVTVVV